MGGERSVQGIIAVGNLKGGVGKTTIAINLACALAAYGRVQLIDTDPQASATEWCQAGSLPIQAEWRPAWDDGRAWIDHIRHKAADYVVIDLPPMAGLDAQAAVAVADLFLVPCTPAIIDRRATTKLIAVLRQARAMRGGVRPFCVVVPSRVDRRLATGLSAERDLALLGELVGPIISQRSALQAAAASGQWIGDHAPGADSHHEFTVLARISDQLCRAARAGSQPRPGLRAFP